MNGLAQMKTIGSTESISSLSGQHIPAAIIQEGEKVYIIREEENGKRQKGLLEKDIRFYMRSRRCLLEEQTPVSNITLYATSRCNLRCPVCFEDETPGGVDITLDQIRELLRSHKRKIVFLAGREPTCREDLPDMIRLIARRNVVILITNGVKLANLEYVRKLKKAGLSGVVFSFNGLRDDVYIKTNGAPLLDIKLQALNNLKREGIRTNLSVTLVRGVNDDQLKGMVQYCMENRQLRIRSLAHLGRYVKEQPYVLSELVDLVANSLNVGLDDFMKEETLRETVKKILRIRSCPRLCSIRFHLWGRRVPRPIAMDFDPLSIDRSSFKRIVILFWAIRHYGLLYLRDFVQKLPFVFRKLLAPPLLAVEFRVWPNVDNIDLIENRKCSSGFFREGRLQPFCYANIAREVEIQVRKMNT
jgi:uncharacterized Fe-S cluster-containing radical SAM superfamily protein